MPFKFVVRLRACCVAAALMWTAAGAAESQTPSLVGATREQVLQRLGEPRSSIVAGSREVLLFARERVVLRNNVVTEVDLLPAEPAPRAVSPPSENVPADESRESRPSAEQTPQQESSPSEAAAAPAPAPSDAPLEIRSVRPAGSSPRPARRPEPTPAPTTSASNAATPATKPSTPTVPPSKPVDIPPAESSAPATVATVPATETAASTQGAAADQPKASSETPAARADVAEAAEKTEEVVAEPAAKEPAKAAPRRRREQVELEEPEVFTTNTYVIACVIVFGGIGYLVWRSRQRKLELAATAVSRTPFAAPVAAPTGTRFTPELLAKLEWKRFEQLVAAYYGKTGVVAVRTNTGPSSPVHIKISWKGESRPFAYVQCIAHPTGLVDAKPVQELVASLMADDIRRGYVVTSGKFSVPARDFAEEKHITLLPGDIFLEKLNALPDGARNELMQEVATGDYSTPSCPTCDAKMVRSPDDPTQWRCPTHPDVVIPAWK